ncbi:MAG: hypothetical protein QM765_48340 [Myxococcales bacterium]
MARAAVWAALGGLVVIVGACSSGGSSGALDAAGIVSEQDGAIPAVDSGFDAGIPDAAEEPPDAAAPGPDATIVQPTLQGWTFFGTGNGGPGQVFGATVDEGGNLWVAGGQSGLFVMKSGTTRYQHFGLAEGLHPWGEPYPGSKQGPVTSYDLNVISVAGGPAGTAFVGYEGSDPPGAVGCEDNWDGPNPDPNIYKSGDADRVSLTASGIAVSHYDISSPPDFVPAEPAGREKLCKVYRIRYDKKTNGVWFGANHGYAWGNATSTQVWEHAHPILNGYKYEDSTTEVALTGGYYGLTVDSTGTAWIGGIHRSMSCFAGVGGLNFFDCEDQGTDKQARFSLDWWKDPLPSDSRPSQRTDDYVSGMAMGLDGSLWISSSTNGLAHRKTDGTVEFFKTPAQVSSVAVDPLDGSVWVGGRTGGLTRIQAGVFTDWSVVGLPGGEIPDIQVDRSGAQRRIVVSFKRGTVGVYDGP